MVPVTVRRELPELVRSAVNAHRDSRGPLLPVLQELQNQIGHLDDEVISLVAQELNLSRADVHGVVTFYRDLRTEPSGDMTVRLCRGEACQAAGAEHFVAEVEQALAVNVGQTRADGTITLDQVFCLGNCALGPAAQVNGRLYGRVDSARLREILNGEAS